MGAWCRNYGSCHSDAAFQHTARTLAGVWLPSLPPLLALSPTGGGQGQGTNHRIPHLAAPQNT